MDQLGFLQKEVVRLMETNAGTLQIGDVLRENDFHFELKQLC